LSLQRGVFHSIRLKKRSADEVLAPYSILRLSFLAPEIVKAILRDRHPLELTAIRLANELRLPIAWDEQRALLGSS
jgi:hypothetical protein